ncbi:hypothetical protein BKA58DRAFT_443330 [Alternaria rosae]|uniref:uncharacterized protein n=1 Tax=Alternaria rosae TaxID=1187941 RepID=UPI001E8D53C6|nr:uncharacterized protein BKA58DRAFT_443330 [Alternaria rosae]KAH6865277.1 hypothetical protein BKA58DRAFT_443330 [Alternaria rosae]
MGKNKIRSKDKSRKGETSISETNSSSTPSTWTSAHGAVIPRSTSNTSDHQQLPTEPPEKTLCVPTITSLKDTTSSSPSSGSSPAPPITRVRNSEEKRDSVISSIWEGPKQPSKPKATTIPKPFWGFMPRNWWPCRIIRWIYHFFVALTRIRWTDRQTSKDLMLTLAFIGIVFAGGYVALDMLLNAIPGVSAQAIDGNCSIVYVTVPGPIITVSLVGASPTNPAKGTYYFSVVNSTTEWLDSIAPPSRFSTLPTRTADFTPIVSSVGVSSMPSSGAAIMSSSLGPTTSALFVSGPLASSSFRQLLRRAIDRSHHVTVSCVHQREFQFDTRDTAKFNYVAHSEPYIQPCIVVELAESAFDQYDHPKHLHRFCHTVPHYELVVNSELQCDLYLFYAVDFGHHDELFGWLQLVGR